jgi:regulator of replication initiation timing
MNPATLKQEPTPIPTSPPDFCTDLEQIVECFNHVQTIQRLKAKLHSLNNRFWDLFAEVDLLRRENRALQHENSRLEERIGDLEGQRRVSKCSEL